MEHRERVRGAWTWLVAGWLLAGGCASDEGAGRSGSGDSTGGGMPGAAADTVVDEAVVGRYVVRVLGPNDDAQRVVVLRDGRVVHELPIGWRLRIGRSWGQDSMQVAPGTDVNADGTPDVTLWDWSGGAHCCLTVTIVSLGDTVGVLETVEGGNAGVAFANRDADPALEVAVADNVFAYWPSSFAESVLPPVVLDWTAAGLAASPALTFRRVDEDSVMALAGALRRELDWSGREPNSSNAARLFGPMIQLTYSGQPELAQRFYQRARPEGHREYLDRLLIEFGTLLGRSRYWRTLEDGLRESR